MGGKHRSFEETHDGEMKLCTHCGHWKHSSMFNRNKRTKDGLACWCRKCANQANRDSRCAGGSRLARERLRRGREAESRCLAAAEHLRGSWSLGDDREAARWERDKALELVAQEAEQRKRPYMDTLAKVGALAASEQVISPCTGKRKGWFKSDGV